MPCRMQQATARIDRTSLRIRRVQCFNFTCFVLFQFKHLGMDENMPFPLGTPSNARWGPSLSRGVLHFLLLSVGNVKIFVDRHSNCKNSIAQGCNGVRGEKTVQTDPKMCDNFCGQPRTVLILTYSVTPSSTTVMDFQRFHFFCYCSRNSCTLWWIWRHAG